MSLIRPPLRVAVLAVALLILPLAAEGAAPATGGADAPAAPVATQILERQIDRAVTHYTDGEFEKAEKLLADVLRSDTATERLRALAAFNRGAALLQLDRYAEAIEAFDAAETETFPFMGQLHLARGIAWEQLGRNDKAAYDYSIALAIDPSNPAIRRRIDAFFYKK